MSPCDKANQVIDPLRRMQEQIAAYAPQYLDKLRRTLTPRHRSLSPEQEALIEESRQQLHQLHEAARAQLHEIIAQRPIQYSITQPAKEHANDPGQTH